MKTVAISILSLVLLSASCKKNKKCSRDYQLEHPVSVYPIKESYTIGDTIWFEMNFPDVFNSLVTDMYNGAKEHYESIQLKDFDFHRNFLRIFKLQDNTIPAFGQEDAWNAFTSIHILGNVVFEGQEGLEYKLLYSNGIYHMKIGVICNESGNFLFSPLFLNYYFSACFGGYYQDLTPACEQEIITRIHFPVNRQPNGTCLTNYHLFKQFMNEGVSNDTNRIKNQCFTFVVN
jgi:hypothetical protein